MLFAIIAESYVNIIIILAEVAIHCSGEVISSKILFFSYIMDIILLILWL